MRFIGREARPWFGGVISVVAGAAVLLVMLSAPSLKYAAVECVNTALAYPEKPALYIRNIVKLSGNWVLERATLNERVERLELERQALAEALQRAGAVPAAPRESYVRAVVTLRYPQDWWQEFRIDKGTRDGVAENAAVTSEGYFVGRVVRAGGYFLKCDRRGAGRFRREWRGAELLRESGIPVVEYLACGDSPNGGCLITRALPESESVGAYYWRKFVRGRENPESH